MAKTNYTDPREDFPFSNVRKIAYVINRLGMEKTAKRSRSPAKPVTANDLRLDFKTNRKGMAPIRLPDD
ncbi:MAG: hypothetical protein COV67_11940 [Nitrospinae bacterium CG11_big_fil_rev_8_21_14_0_20_56_8]|nr:MAG: hypothetical protein COV67_11940 [Nitrospinae bacterium CG11_big_fil_rev_8_21_14_0_20_56_8]